HTSFSRDWSSDVCSSDLNFTWTGTLNQGEHFAFVRVASCGVWGPWSDGRPFRVDRLAAPDGPNVVRILGSSLCDNDGPFLALGEIGRASCREGVQGAEEA